MPIANRSTQPVAQAISAFSAREQRQINDALNVLEQSPLAPGYRCTRQTSRYGNVLRTIEVGAAGIRIDYRYDAAGLITIIDIYRSRWHAVKVLIGGFSP